MDQFSKAETKKLLSFIGYGWLDAPIWLMGMEEGGGGEANLRTRLKFDPVMDLAEAQRMLCYYEHFELPRPKIQPTWQVLIKIILGLLEKPSTPEIVAEYQARRLGSKNGHTLLTELMPLPVPNTGQWPYGDLFADPRLSSRELYQKSIKRQRVQLLRGLIQKHEPRLAICYGKSFWTDFRRLFPDTEFQPATLRHPTDPGRKPTPADRFEYGRAPYGGIVIRMAHPVARGVTAKWRLEQLVDRIGVFQVSD